MISKEQQLIDKASLKFILESRLTDLHVDKDVLDMNSSYLNFLINTGIQKYLLPGPAKDDVHFNQKTSDITIGQEIGKKRMFDRNFPSRYRKGNV